jgi:hypothetical protein
MQPPDRFTQTSAVFSSLMTVLSGAVVFSLPAMIPATCVPWKETRASSGSRPSAPEPGPGNDRATITFWFVNCALPFGNPDGTGSPLSAKNGFRSSIPSSTTATLIPSPRNPVAARSWVAPISAPLRFVSIVYSKLG